MSLATLAPAEPQVTRSALEERFLALVAGAGLPRPRTNVLLHGFEVDVLWPPRSSWPSSTAEPPT
ncbi:MAG: hypothetical protein M3P39_04800 [Actinomycetota bacterium]|nr:hypothetical protein [Actinomycetota bacterium]